MGTKYTIEVEDKPFELLSEDGFTSEKLYRVKGFNSLVFDRNGLNMLTPYTEPDTEQIRCQAYEEGRNSLLIEVQKAGKNTIKLEEDEYYQRGLSDAWECARKIRDMTWKEQRKVFGTDIYTNIIALSASECIEKIRQYEQKQEQDAEIKVGDEVEGDEDGQRGVVIDSRFENSQVAVLTGNSKVYSWWSKCAIHKTGRHFPEIAAVLEKMREE